MRSQKWHEALKPPAIVTLVCGAVILARSGLLLWFVFGAILVTAWVAFFNRRFSRKSDTAPGAHKQNSPTA